MQFGQPLSQAKQYLKTLSSKERRVLPQTDGHYHEMTNEDVLLPKSHDAPHKREITLKGELIGLSHLLSGWVNYLLIFVPIGFLAEHYEMDAAWRFGLNFVALIPLANLLGNATEEVAIHTGEIIGGLLNATFGNAVEMIITIQALRAGMIDLVKGTLLGSILSNLLLVLGMAFLWAGIKYPESSFNALGAGANTSLLLLSCLGIALPSISAFQAEMAVEAVLSVSRYTAVLIATTYVLFLVFQLFTHSNVFQESEKDSDSDEDEEEEEACISLPTAMAVLFLVTLITSFSSDILVDSVKDCTEQFNISQLFIGIILLPLAGNATEHWTAVTVAGKNKLDLSIGVAAGSSTQIALFVMPFAVLMGWVYGIPMALDFTAVELSILFISVLIVMGVSQDGKSNWLEGAMLIVAYCLVAILFWFTPDASAKVPAHLMGN